MNGKFNDDFIHRFLENSTNLDFSQNIFDDNKNNKSEYSENKIEQEDYSNNNTNNEAYCNNNIVDQNEDNGNEENNNENTSTLNEDFQTWMNKKLNEYGIGTENETKSNVVNRIKSLTKYKEINKEVKTTNKEFDKENKTKVNTINKKTNLPKQLYQPNTTKLKTNKYNNSIRTNNPNMSVNANNHINTINKNKSNVMRTAVNQNTSKIVKPVKNNNIKSSINTNITKHPVVKINIKSTNIGKIKTACSKKDNNESDIIEVVETIGNTNLNTNYHSNNNSDINNTINTNKSNHRGDIGNTKFSKIQQLHNIDYEKDIDQMATPNFKAYDNTGKTNVKNINNINRFSSPIKTTISIQLKQNNDEKINRNGNINTNASKRPMFYSPNKVLSNRGININNNTTNSNTNNFEVTRQIRSLYNTDSNQTRLNNRIKSYEKVKNNDNNKLNKSILSIKSNRNLIKSNEKLGKQKIPNKLDNTVRINNNINANKINYNAPTNKYSHLINNFNNQYNKKTINNKKEDIESFYNSIIKYNNKRDEIYKENEDDNNNAIETNKEDKDKDKNSSSKYGNLIDQFNMGFYGSGYNNAISKDLNNKNILCKNTNVDRNVGNYDNSNNLFKIKKNEFIKNKYRDVLIDHLNNS